MPIIEQVKIKELSPIEIIKTIENADRRDKIISKKSYGDLVHAFVIKNEGKINDFAIILKQLIKMGFATNQDGTLTIRD